MSIGYKCGYDQDPKGRHVIWSRRGFHQDLAAIGVYAPNMSQEAFWKKLGTMVGISEHSVLMLGDFNNLINPELDCTGNSQIDRNL